MSDDPNRGGSWLGTKISPPGPATWIGHTWREFICKVLTCLLNPHFKLLYDAGDGVNSLSKDCPVYMGPGGYTVEIPLTGIAAGGGGGITQFQLVSDGGDYYLCYQVTGWTMQQVSSLWTPVAVVLGTNLVKVAKTPDLMCTLPSGSPNGGAFPSKLKRGGITYTYTYTQVMNGSVVVEYTRSVSGSDGNSGTSYVTPYLAVGDIINAIPCNFTSPASLTGVQWLALADGRTWSDPT